MASSASSSQVEARHRAESTPAPATAEADGRPAPSPQHRSRPPKPGHLPVTELAFDKQGAASPFGDDIAFPLPVDKLAFIRPDTSPPAAAE